MLGHIPKDMQWLQDHLSKYALYMQVLIWSYPDVEKSPLALQTDHAANIFGVQFMPCTNNRQIITGAMDDTVMLHNIERLPAQLSRRGSGSPVPVAFHSTMYGCHRARVKVMLCLLVFACLSVALVGPCITPFGCRHARQSSRQGRQSLIVCTQGAYAVHA